MTAHRCTAQSASAIAAQFGPWVFTDGAPRCTAACWTESKRAARMPDGSLREVPVWTMDGWLRLRCPFTGEWFHFVRRIGAVPLGFSPPADFSTLIASVPQAASAWGSLQGQIQAESTPSELSGNLYTAASHFVSSYNQLASTTAGLDPGQLANSAQAIVTQANTVLGAAQTVGNLASSVSKLPPSQAMRAVTGLLVDGLTLAGAISGGVGGAIIAGVSIAVNALGGAFDPPSFQGVEVCPGFSCDPNTVAFVVKTTGPAGAIGCCCVTQLPGQPAQIPPGAPIWRSFPDVTVPDDLEWFIGKSGDAAISLDWRGARYLRPIPYVNGTTRFIDTVFPQYRTLECNASQIDPNDPLAGLLRAFFNAWRANAAIALNGFKPASDADVLAQTLVLWNRAHAPGTGASLSAASGDLLGPTDYCVTGSSTVPLYASLLVDLVGASAVPGIGSYRNGDGSLQVNTGPMKQFVGLHPVGGGHASPGLGLVQQHGALAASPMTTGAKLAIGTVVVAAVAAGGAAGYGLLTGEGAGFLFGKALQSMTGAFEEARVAAEAPGRASMRVQSLLFDRYRFSTTRAKAWAKRNGYHYGDVEVSKTGMYIHLRQRAPRGQITRTITLAPGVKARVQR